MEEDIEEDIKGAVKEAFEMIEMNYKFRNFPSKRTFIFLPEAKGFAKISDKLLWKTLIKRHFNFCILGTDSNIVCQHLNNNNVDVRTKRKQKQIIFSQDQK